MQAAGWPRSRSRPSRHSGWHCARRRQRRSACSCRVSAAWRRALTAAARSAGRRRLRDGRSSNVRLAERLTLTMDFGAAYPAHISLVLQQHPLRLHSLHPEHASDRRHISSVWSTPTQPAVTLAASAQRCRTRPPTLAALGDVVLRTPQPRRHRRWSSAFGPEHSPTSGGTAAIPRSSPTPA